MHDEKGTGDSLGLTIDRRWSWNAKARAMKQATFSIVVVLSAVPAFADPALEELHSAKPVLELEADGVQIYACEARDGGFRWTFQGPEAALFDARGRQFGTNGTGPKWTFSDGSSVVGEVVSKKPAPDTHAVPWLKLAVTSSSGSGVARDLASIRRIETEGGLEPADICDAAHVGEIARMRYSATYQFFAK
jgi:hypothetical protein